jgi:hypothetical protein
MTYAGHIENGQVVFDAAPGLPEGTPVVVSVVATAAEGKPERESPTLYEQMRPIIGIAEHLPPDASSKIDEVLYGRGRS